MSNTPSHLLPRSILPAALLAWLLVSTAALHPVAADQPPAPGVVIDLTAAPAAPVPVPAVPAEEAAAAAAEDADQAEEAAAEEAEPAEDAEAEAMEETDDAPPAADQPPEAPAQDRRAAAEARQQAEELAEKVRAAAEAGDPEAIRGLILEMQALQPDGGGRIVLGEGANVVIEGGGRLEVRGGAVEIRAGNLQRVARNNPIGGISRININADAVDPDPTTGRLAFADGQVISGQLIGSADGALAWQSPLFDEVALIDQQALTSVRLPKIDPPATPEDPMVVTFTDGGRLYGRFVAMDDDHVTVTGNRTGDVRIRRDQVSSLQWLRQGDLLWSGPHGTAGWSYRDPPVPARAWTAETAGRLQTVGWRQDVQLNLEIPALVELDLQLEAADELRFEVKLEAGDASTAIATWGDELVLLRGEDFVSLGRHNPEADLALRWFWDRANDRGMVTDAAGNIRGRWQVDAERAGQVEERDGAALLFLPPREANGDATAAAPDDHLEEATFTMVNRGPSLDLSRLQVRRWSGSEPERRSIDQVEGPRLELAGDRTIVLGDQTRLLGDDGALRLVTGANGDSEEIPVDRIEAIWLAAAAGEGTEPVADGAPGEVAVRFADGTLWHGTMQELADDQLVLGTAYSDQPIVARAADLLRIDFLHAIDPGWTDGSRSGDDRVMIESQVLTGQWQPAADQRPRWRLPGALEGVLVAADRDHEFNRSIALNGDPELPPALLHLVDGQVIPGRVVAIARDGAAVELHSDVCETTVFPAERIRALQYPGEGLKAAGFTDTGWQVSSGKLGENVLFDDRAHGGGKVTLLENGGWAHPGILFGSEFSFTMVTTTRGALRLRLFNDPDETDGSSTALIIAQNGNQVHCGVEIGQNNFSSSGYAEAPMNEPVGIRLSWDDEQIHIDINGERTASIDLDDDAGFGRYLGFELAELWRTVNSQIAVSDFALTPMPGVASTPAINRQAREQALLLPRFLRDDPPRQVLLARNGDLLRGTLEGGDGEHFAFRTGMRSYRIPGDRTAAAIWLTPAPDDRRNRHLDTEATEATAEAEPEAAAGDDEPAAPEGPLYTLLLRSGGALSLHVDSFGPEFVTGRAAGLGACRIPVDQIGTVQSGDRDLGAINKVFAGWQLEHAPDPLPVAGGQDGRTAPLVGQEATPFELPLLGAVGAEEEATFNLADHAGRVVVLDFWATWCAICVRSIPEKMEAFAAFDPDKVSFIAVNQAEAPDLIRPFIAARGWDDLVVGLDRDQSIGRSFQAAGLPHSVIIGPDGRIAWVSTGFRRGGSRALVDIVERLLE